MEKHTAKIPQAIRNVNALLRRTQAWQFREQGFTYVQIGNFMGVSHTRAQQLVEHRQREIDND